MCLRELYWRKILPRKAVSTNHIQIYSADLLRQIRWACLVSLSSQELKMCSPRHKLATIVSSNEVPLPLPYTLHNLPHVGSLCHSRRIQQTNGRWTFSSVRCLIEDLVLLGWCSGGTRWGANKVDSGEFCAIWVDLSCPEIPRVNHGTG